MAIVITATGIAVVESNSNDISFSIELLGGPASDVVTVKYRTLLAGTGGDEDLYIPTTNYDGIIEFQPGETTKQILVSARTDSLDELDEHIVLELYDPSEGTFDGGTATFRVIGVIQDDDGPGSNLAYFVSDPVIVEGDAGTKFATFEVRLSRPAPSAFAFNYETVDGTASAGSDYVAATGVLNFAPNQETATITVEIKGDLALEATEAFFLSVQPQTGAPVLGRAGAIGEATVLDDDTGTGPVISLSGGASVVESNSTYIRFVATLSEPSNDAVTVNFRSLLTGTASDPDLYVPTSWSINNGLITFAPGETSKDILIAARHDTIDERDEHIVVELFDPTGARLAGGLPVLGKSGVILDDDGAGANLSIFVSDPVVLEGASGSKVAVFEVRLSRPTTQAFTAGYKTVDESAVAGTDYLGATGSISFKPGQDVAYVTIPVIGDTIAETSETFSLIVTPPANPSIGTDGAVGMATIMDDDSSIKPVITLSGGEGVVEANSTYVRYVVTLSKASLEVVTVAFNTQLGTATNADLEVASTHGNNNGTVTFAPGETSKSIFIAARHDTIDERDETISLTLSNPANAVFAGNYAVLRETGFILDDDGVDLNIALSGTNAVISEGTSLPRLEVAVKLSRPVTATTVFNVTATGQSATAGVDFQLVDTKVTFAPGQTVATITVNILADKISEAEETFSLNFTLASGPFPPGVIPSAVVTIRPGAILGTAATETVNGGAHPDTVYGLDGNDRLNGLGSNDTLIGGNGNDILDGGLGADLLAGGIGNDTYITDAADTVSEAANAGTDTMQSSVSRNLSLNVENLVLLGTAAINGGGNVLANRITGNSGNNILSGGGGTDTLVGGLGNDVYNLENGNDIVSDAGGIDSVTSTITRSIANFGSIENVSLVGTAAINASGNSLANVLRGNNSANALDGGAGNDTLLGNGGNDNLNGGLGNDLLYGGIGFDSFTFNTALNASTNVDRIGDFYYPEDTIRLDNAVMAGLGATLGTLAAAKFWKSTAGLAHDTDDRIIYDTDTGRLFYDSNGNAAGGAVHFATVGVNLALTNADFVVI